MNVVHSGYNINTMNKILTIKLAHNGYFLREQMFSYLGVYFLFFYDFYRHAHVGFCVNSSIN